MAKQGPNGISWCEATWNPIRGCTRVSEGCRNCYAERVAARFGGEGQPYEGLARMTSVGPRWTGEVRVVKEHLYDPTHWKKPRRIFVNSMSDLFHPAVSDSTLSDIFSVMLACPHHTFQVLTKRPERMRSFLLETCFDIVSPERKRHIWLGVSVEDQETADERIPHLAATPAAVRWISYEPALGPIDLTHAFGTWRCPKCHARGYLGEDHSFCPQCEQTIMPIREPSLSWVVAGGESGPGARPCHPDWFRQVRDQCREAGVAFHFKQWGEWLPGEVRLGSDLLWRAFFQDGSGPDTHPGAKNHWWRGFDAETHQPGIVSVKVGKHKAGRRLDGRIHDDYPEVPR